jgi:hypothetical protein
MFLAAATVETGERWATPDPALVNFNGPSERVRVLRIDGTLWPAALCGFEIFCRNARRDDLCSAVVLVINCWRSPWDMGDWLEAWGRLGNEKVTVAHIEIAIGSVLELAMLSHKVFATPVAEIGKLGCFCSNYDGGLESEPLDERTIEALQSLRTNVANTTWRRLLHGTTSGEGAEFFGIVDGLSRSPAAIVDQLTRNREG